MIKISEAGPESYAAIQSIALRTWPVAYGKILSKAQLDYMLELFYSTEALAESKSKGHRFLLAEEDYELGFLSYQNNFDGNLATRINKLYVLPETQGTGIGRLLIDKVSEIATNAGDIHLSLNVNRQNSAKDFYQKSGFRIVGAEDVPLDHGYLMEDYIMEKAL